MNKIPTDIINIEAGNDVILCFPIVFRRFENGKAIDEIPDRLDFIHSVVITHNGVAQSYDFTTDGNKVFVHIPATLEAGSYDVHISGNNNGAISTVRKSSFCIVPYSYMANASDYIQGSPILMPTSIFVASSNISGMKTLVINVPLEDVARIINSSKTEGGFPNEYLVNADLGFGMNEINAFIDGKLNVQLMTNLKGALSEEDFIVTMMLDNVIVQQFPEDGNTLLNGERILYIIGLSWINDIIGNSFNCSFILSEHYCTAILEDIKTPDYSNAIAQAQQTADDAKQTAETALEATQVTDPTNGSYPTPIGEALNNVYSATQVTDPTNGSYPTPISDALSNVHMEAETAKSDAFNAQTSADSAYQRADEAYNYAMGIVVPPDNSWEVQQAQSRADEAYTRADEAYNEASNAASAASSAQSTANEALGATQVTDPTTNSPGVAINDALNNVYNNLNDKIQNSNNSDEILKILLRNFGTSATFDAGKNSISFSDVDLLLFLIYQKCKEFIANYESVNNEDLYHILGDRYITIGMQGVITHTMLLQGVSFDNPYMQIVVDDKTSALFGQLVGVQGLKYIRMMDSPIGNSYWKFVLEDGTEILPTE